jgi:hypothetical protein
VERCDLRPGGDIAVEHEARIPLPLSYLSLAASGAVSCSCGKFEKMERLLLIDYREQAHQNGRYILSSSIINSNRSIFTQDALNNTQTTPPFHHIPEC